MTRRPKRWWSEYVLHGFVLLVLLALLFPGVFFRAEFAVPGSLLFKYEPWKSNMPDGTVIAANFPPEEAMTQFSFWYRLVRGALENGEWPLWNHLEYTGMPLLANFQSAVFYPPHMLHTFLDVCTAMTVYALLKLWICGMTAYLCARTMGLGRPASRFASIAWMMTAFNVLWCYWNEADVSGWVPLLLVGVELLIRERYRRGFFTVALSGTLLLLAGHPESALITSAGVGIYFVLRLLLDRRRGRRLWAPLVVALAGWAVALAVCAVQLAPFLEYLVHSHTMAYRADAEGFRPVIAKAAAVAFWVPRFFGSSADSNYWGKYDNSNFTSLLYPGVIVWVGASLLLSRSKDGAHLRKKAIALAVPGVFFALMAFNVPVLRPLLAVPLIGSTWGLWHISFVAFALAFLGGLGIEYWFSKPRGPRDLTWPVLALAAVAAGIAWLYLFYDGLIEAQGLTRYIQVQILVAALLALIGLSLAALAIVLRNRRPVLAGLLAVLLACDLLVAARGVLPTSPREHLFPETRLTNYLLGLDQPCRIGVTSTPIHPGLLPNYGIEQLWGYDGIFPERIVRFFGLAATGGWNAMEPVCAVSYRLFLEGRGPSGKENVFQLVESMDGIDVYENTRAFPRAFLVGQLESAPDADALFTRMNDLAYDPSATVITESPPGGPWPDTDSDDLGTARVLDRTSTRMTVEVDANEACILVVSEAYYPGWQARIGQKPAEIFPAYYAFRGVIVPEGHHIVEYRYKPWPFRLGLGLSVVALVAGAVISLFVLGRRKVRT